MDLHGNRNLNLPVPFKAGDIIEVDGYPYSPKVHVLILDIGDNCDCCSLVGISRNRHGLWDIGAVKHGCIGYDHFYIQQISPLYTARTYDGKLRKNEEMLLWLKEYICDDAEKAERVHSCLSYNIGNGGVSDEKMEQFFNEGFDWKREHEKWKKEMGK